jgi:two-component system CheB/CheR fusion protein
VNRTYELQQAIERLAEKNTELEKMNKELESFTYVSSHDLQEPLRKIQIFATRILEKEKQNLSDKGKNHFRQMQDAAARMQTLIQDLLAFSRISTGDRKFETTDLDKT